MSSGGFYKYRCKYFYTHNCPNWVYVNGTACASCSSHGRDTESAPSQAPVMWYSKEICVPRVEGGVLYYTLMEVEAVPTDAAGNYWAVKYKVNKQTQPPVPTTTSALPGTPITTTSL
ncbi:hypothetical protein HD806DRAFT_496105 [Xylariaceae sp. AK1471]|nr:hypothetical protein HD806DRAFT_496105 [Xylariaceae sp. AK1471]